MGGMAAQIPIKDDKAANDAALTKVRVLTACCLRSEGVSGVRLLALGLLIHFFSHRPELGLHVGWGGLFNRMDETGCREARGDFQKRCVT